MVLQRERPVTVWGWADKGQQVTVEFAGQTSSATADDGGAWQVMLKPMKPTGEGRDLSARANGESLVIRDVVVGDVWHASGQSNMAMTVGDVARRLPQFEQAEIADGKVTVHFAHAESGLMVATKDGLADPKEAPETKLSHFELADNTGQWHAAEAEIRGQTVIVRSEEVPNPVAVRYAYAISPQHCNLYNRDGLPAAPFCSDPTLLKYAPQLPSEQTT